MNPKITKKAITAAGGVPSVAQRLEISIQAVYKWLKKGRIPAGRVLLIEKLSGVTRYKLRPDIYGLAENEVVE